MGKSLSTITLGSSEYASLSYSQYIDVATKGNMYEKKALGIVDDKHRIHTETINNSKATQQLKAEHLNKPIFDTKPMTQSILKNIQQLLNNASNQFINNERNTSNNQNPSSDTLEFIPLIIASSQATGNQTVTKPLTKKKKNKKELNKEDDYFVNENNEAELLIFWEFEKSSKRLTRI